MDLFGLNRFMDGAGGGPSGQRGLSRWLQTLWDNLGGLLGGNFLSFAGCLPLALGVSLGLVYENLWITLLSGAAGGALAGVCWAAMLSLALQAFQGGTRGWFGRWRRAALRGPISAAGAGAVLGLLSGGLLLVGGFAGQLLTQGGGSPLLVWAVLAVDFFLLCAAAVLVFSALCVRENGGEREGKRLLALLFAAPGRACGAAGGTLLWFGLGVALFPVSVPFALALGFWPPALFTAQLMLPGLTECFLMPEWEQDGRGAAEGGTGIKQAGEIWWRRRWPVVVILTAVIGLLLWGGNQLFAFREPDLQIAVVHGSPLPDSVRRSLENSLAALVGDRNGDGAAVVLVNDYTVVFDGSAVNVDQQTAGATLLVSDVAAGVSALYLVEDPEGFLVRYSDKVDGESPSAWGSYPVLAGLDAGTYSALEDMETDLSGQSLLASLTVLPGLSAGDGVLELLLKEAD